MPMKLTGKVGDNGTVIDIENIPKDAVVKSETGYVTCPQCGNILTQLADGDFICDKCKKEFKFVEEK